MLGHCTGRLIVGRGRPESTFDAHAVFEQAVRYDRAIEINSRPERLDPPRPLLMLAKALGCRFAIDSDAHATDQWWYAETALAHARIAGVPRSRVINCWPLAQLLEWAHSRSKAA